MRKNEITSTFNRLEWTWAQSDGYHQLVYACGGHSAYCVTEDPSKVVTELDALCMQTYTVLGVHELVFYNVHMSMVIKHPVWLNFGGSDM